MPWDPLPHHHHKKYPRPPHNFYSGFIELDLGLQVGKFSLPNFLQTGRLFEEMFSRNNPGVCSKHRVQIKTDQGAQFVPVLMSSRHASIPDDVLVLVELRRHPSFCGDRRHHSSELSDSTPDLCVRARPRARQMQGTNNSLRGT